MKTKIVDETFDEKTGLTTVTIQNKYGRFTGIAQCHFDDDYSMFQGERVAVARANIEFCKFRIKQEKAKILALKDIYINPHVDLDNFSEFLANHRIRRIIYRNTERYKKTIEHYQNSIEILKNSIKLMDEERQKVLLRSNKNK